jgi:hypothetical protein
MIAKKRLCVNCLKYYLPGARGTYFYTCSKICHEALIIALEQKFGIYKKVTDVETQVTYKVPVRDIAEKGLTYQDLKFYPVWITYTCSVCNHEFEEDEIKQLPNGKIICEWCTALP